MAAAVGSSPLPAQIRERRVLAAAKAAPRHAANQGREEKVVEKSRKPVVVNAPPGREAPDQHPLLAGLIDDRSIVLVPGDPDADALARTVLASVAARRRGQLKPEAAIADLWARVVAVIDDAAGDRGDPVTVAQPRGALLADPGAHHA
jgi:hypothetical protein